LSGSAVCKAVLCLFPHYRTKIYNILYLKKTICVCFKPGRFTVKRLCKPFCVCFTRTAKGICKPFYRKKTICGDFKPGRFTENSESADYDSGKNINRDCLKLTVFF